MRDSVRVLAFALITPLAAAHASSFKVLYSFTGGSDEGEPDSANLVLDNSSNLYGTTALPLGKGAVFKLDRKGHETVLYYFPAGAKGALPQALVMDAKKNLFGTTAQGGLGGGIIFEITSSGKEKLIYTFGQRSPHDGCDAEGPMVADTSGNFYGTTISCGKHDYGTVFTLATHGSESLVYSFKGGRDGFYPVAGLITDIQGNFYGSTDSGGKIGFCTPENFDGCGTIFKLSPSGTKTELYRFNGPPNDGELPAGKLLMNSAGVIYGSTIHGGIAGCEGDESCGVVFKLTPDGRETVVHFFAGEASDGGNPVTGLVADDTGNLYGTTQFGGGSDPCNGADGCGTIFKIASDGTYTIIHKFKESTDGANPITELVADGAGNLYGTANAGGKYGYGTVFEITP